MLVQFNELPPTARVWIYQLNRSVTAPEKTDIEKTIQLFCQQWQAHGAPLKTSYQLLYDHFLVLAVDENTGGASGCSIDGSVRVLKELGAKLNLDFFDRTLVAFLVDNSVLVYPISKLKELFANGTLSTKAITFNNLVSTKEDFLKNWMTPANKSWLARFLPKSTLA